MKTIRTASFVATAIIASAIVAGASNVHASTADRPGDVKGFSQPTSTIDTTDGPLSGRDDGSFVSFLGIPYAQPPVGELRWMPPKAVEKRQSVWKADKLGSSCLQNGSLGVFATPGGSEDCLYLNVYADNQAFNRARATSKGLPVFVWIHGGALHVGQGADYDPRALAAEGKAIVVTINYRLGMFGFMAHPSLDKEGHPKANYGHVSSR
jgi:para-nitrobenzyl esterase